ncbi:voltage-dependent calcium channel beta subunit-associated regulatory protein [Melanotaenia boesemani]|uniref:voltage-dependent calcium channel beta subunit-associated regulatory protein n=1 Tax=Melanotaenia boesemani TaxID=1250792 RepID=UPI001C05822F|nr:voltage-dependent calcium channel beta subunit-associated regulatory protein [Melanotaenia boesemani]XP_041862259.1 voltage-dependent calcium channel beta subunit-associated regulatory protein [Melanotaenia boesemani]XP_041862260.1 voltage-dependent calcium channel beta subunit-associated regulatory protein [Melanotaenia boesemani]XP_041862261.1 voltage-dependent calcium channel beta subunit-associated regulatory protein [Melanotaenia boesemani]XP_041862262.1 voltage-dependent calcium channe
MSNESTVWNILPENSTEIPFEAEEQQDGYVLLLVIVSIFLVGTLIFISVFLIACRRCCGGGQFCVRASDDPEKTTTYMEESQPTHEITIRVDESDCLSMASSHDQETERFLSTGPTGRRVSFNEAALFDQERSKKTQEKGRRYTLTEGDFHHLKNARLTNLHIPPPALKIVTIHECDSAENTITMTTRPVAKSALSIFQPMLCPLPQTALTSLSVSPSCALPGDALNSVVDTSFCDTTIALSTMEPSSSSFEMMGAGPQGRGSSVSVGERAVVGNSAFPAVQGGAGSPRPVLQFLTKLRRHASLEGASPYFKIKKWKLDSSQRASSLDTRGSPKRRQFQRQRAASESMDQEDNDAHHIDLIQYIARTQGDTYCPSQPTTRLLSPPSTPPPSLGRVEVEVMVEPSCSHSGPGVIGLSPDPQEEALYVVKSEGANPSDPLQFQDPQSLYRDIWTLRATLEQYAASDQSSNNDRNSVCSDAESVCSLGGRTDTERGGLPSYPSQDLGDEAEAGEEEKDFFVYMDETLGVKESRKRKQGSTESERGGSDGESGTRKLLQMDSGYASIEAPCRGPEELRLFGNSSGSPKDRTALEKRHHFTNAGRTGTIGESFESYLCEEEPEEELLHGASGGVSIKTGAGSLTWLPYGQMITPREAVQPPPQPLTLHRRDYSIDEKTDALFHEFLRHDPQFDQQDSPRKHRSRIHLRKQWQRHKQWSDPGVRHFQSSFERQRTPLRRGDSVNYPLDTSYHSTLPRIVSAPDEETSDGTGSTPDTPKVDPTTVENEGKQKNEGLSTKDSEEHTSSPPPHHPYSFEKDEGLSDQPDPQEDSKQSTYPPEPPDERSPPQLPDSSGYGPQTITAELTDKLTANLAERLYTGLRRSKHTATECVNVTATHASPDHSPV